MTRALQLLALLSAVFVVALRFYSVFPAATASAPDGLSVSGASEVHPGPAEPLPQDSLAADWDDDSEDGADALIAPARVQLVALEDGNATGLDSRALVEQRARSSHAQSLDRPPRA